MSAWIETTVCSASVFSLPLSGSIKAAQTIPFEISVDFDSVAQSKGIEAKDSTVDNAEDALFASINSVALSEAESADVKGGVAWWVIPLLIVAMIIGCPSPSLY